MRIVVLAQTPPPFHGQSVMVKELVDGLPGLGVEIFHVQMRLSDGTPDIGKWQPTKLIRTIRAALEARRIAAEHDCDVLYYVPAPAKRAALYRDIVAMGICRSRKTKLVLHWHASGLGEWLQTKAWGFERALARRALGRADLSIVLAPSLEADAGRLSPLRASVVPNGIADPGDPPARPGKRPHRILFLGLGSRAKGLWDLLEALALLNGRRPGEFRLTFAGGFETQEDERFFEDQRRALGTAVEFAGFVDGAKKKALFEESDVFCLPTRYANEGQPVALIEAMAYDLPIVTTRWRSIPEMLPKENVWFVDHGRPEELASAIESVFAKPQAPGPLRRHFLQHFTLAGHLAALASALNSLGGQEIPVDREPRR
jgi:glycosyltransferase involved in cell wall biosynthesis